MLKTGLQNQKFANLNLSPGLSNGPSADGGFSAEGGSSAEGRSSAEGGSSAEDETTAEDGSARPLSGPQSNIVATTTTKTMHQVSGTGVEPQHTANPMSQQTANQHVANQQTANPQNAYQLPAAQAYQSPFQSLCYKPI